MVDPVSECVTSAAPVAVVGDGARLVSVERIGPARQPCDAARKTEAGRSPVSRIPIVAGNAGNTGNVHTVTEIWQRLCDASIKRVTNDAGDALGEPMIPREIGGKAGGVRDVRETEEVGIVGARALKIGRDGDTIRVGDHEVCDVALQIVAVSDAENRYLIVVSARPEEVRQRIESDQSLCLRADSAIGNHVSQKSGSGLRIDKW